METHFGIKILYADLWRVNWSGFGRELVSFCQRDFSVGFCIICWDSVGSIKDVLTGFWERNGGKAVVRIGKMAMAMNMAR